MLPPSRRSNGKNFPKDLSGFGHFIMTCGGCCLDSTTVSFQDSSDVQPASLTNLNNGDNLFNTSTNANGNAWVQSSSDNSPVQNQQEATCDYCPVETIVVPNKKCPGLADENEQSNNILPQEPQQPRSASDVKVTPVRNMPDHEPGERLVTMQARAVNVTPAGLNKGYPNTLRTTKFTWATWLPKSIFNQFKRLANMYFLFIVILGLIGSFWSDFSPKDWKSKVGPFVFVIMWTACKDLYEDLRRAKDDKFENHQVVRKYNAETNTFEDIYWYQIHVGDILLVMCDQQFPADLVVLKSWGNETTYISTVMLDGETNLKERFMPKVLGTLAESVPEFEDISATTPAEFEQTSVKFVEKLMETGTEMKMGVPIAVINDVRGVLMMGQKSIVVPLSEANFLPRGCALRNSRYVLATSVYVGEDAKTRLNAIKAQLKFSTMQAMQNICIRGLLVFIFGICLYATIMSEVEPFGSIDLKWSPPLMYFRFCIAYYHAVPMSLYVVYEMLKLILGYQVNIDKSMVHDGESANARTADLMEELGQVDFVFSDKTGTLTANEMVFAKCHIDGKDMGDFRPLSTGSVPEGVRKSTEMLKSNSHKSQAVSWFFTCLATCHEVVVQTDGESNGNATYSGMSPDEVALVSAARDVGITFQSRNRQPGGSTEVEVKNHLGAVSKFEVLVILAFTSDRKRMSVIIKGGGRAWCITKGADSVMEPLIRGGFSEEVAADSLAFSKLGLRVLVIASRELDVDFLANWLMDYEKARGILDETKEARIREVVLKMEKNLDFVGLTAVEDRLQLGVPEAIETIKKIGSRIWVLTGDKVETAVEIAYSCRLFAQATKLAYVIKCTTTAEALAGFDRAAAELEGSLDGGLVIDGETLLVSLTDEACRKMIYQLGLASRCCVCARLSPMQKLQLVQLVRKEDPKRITLTIGDGANDVPMILGGHVGIGIRGKEGAAAVQVCDIAISQFRFLVILLLCHGRRAYRRVAIFFCYYLYKNLVLLMADLLWTHWDRFRGNVAFPEYLSIAYNAFFTSWHVLFVLGYDRDIPDSVACAHPELYKVGPRRELFNVVIFSKWMFYAILHGSVCWLIPYWMVGTDDYDTEKFWIASTAAFTNVVNVALLKMVIESENPFGLWTWWPTIVSFLLFALYLYLISYSFMGYEFQRSMDGIAEHIITNGKVFATLIIAPVAALSLDVIVRLVNRYVFPSELQVVTTQLKALGNTGPGAASDSE